MTRTRVPLRFRFSGGSRAGIGVLIASAATTLALPVVAQPAAGGTPPAGTRETVGRSGTNRVVTPVNQIVTPIGIQVDLPGMRPQTLALSPNGRLLATSGKTHDLVIVDPVTGEILQRVPLPSDKL